MGFEGEMLFLCVEYCSGMRGEWKIRRGFETSEKGRWPLDRERLFAGIAGTGRPEQAVVCGRTARRRRHETSRRPTRFPPSDIICHFNCLLIYLSLYNLILNRKLIVIWNYLFPGGRLHDGHFTVMRVRSPRAFPESVRNFRKIGLAQIRRGPIGSPH